MTTANAIFIVALLFMSVGLMVAGYYFKRPAIALGAAGSWLVTALYTYTLSTALWDINYGLFWLCILMGIVAALEGFTLRPDKSEQTPEEQAQDDTERHIQAYEKRRSDLNRLKRMTNRRNK